MSYPRQKQRRHIFYAKQRPAVQYMRRNLGICDLWISGHPVGQGPPSGGFTRACASVNKRPYITILENTSSSIRNGGGNCGKSKNPTATRIFDTCDMIFACGQSRDFGWVFLGKLVLTDQNPAFSGSDLKKGRGACRCGENRRLFRWKSEPFCPQRVCGISGGKFSVNRLSNAFQKGFPHPERGIIS